MDEDRGELVRHLMAEAAAMLEDAHELAIEGQAQDRSEQELMDVLGSLVETARGVGAVAGAVEVLLRLD